MHRFDTYIGACLNSVREGLRSYHVPFRVYAAVIAIAAGEWMSPAIEAATIYKANNTTGFDVGASWVGSVVPGTSDIACWDSRVTAANTINSGGTNSPQVKGIQILNPGGPVTITYNTTGGNYYYIGSGGIDMSQATQDLSLTGLVLNASMISTVASGRTLTLLTNYISYVSMLGNTWTVNTVGTGFVNESGTIRHNSGTYWSSSAMLIKQGTGTMIISGSNWVGGGVTVSGGVLELNHADALPGGIAATGGTCNLTINGGIVGLANGNFARGLGTGLSQMQFTGSGGFAAFGADRTVNLGGASAGVTWNSGSFVPNGSARRAQSHHRRPHDRLPESHQLRRGESDCRSG